MINGNQASKVMQHEVKITSGLNKPVSVRVPIHRVFNSQVTTGTGWARDAQLPTMCKTNVGHSSNNTGSPSASPVVAAVSSYKPQEFTLTRTIETIAESTTPLRPLVADTSPTLSLTQEKMTVSELIKMFENKISASSEVVSGPPESFVKQTTKLALPPQVATVENVNSIKPSIAQMLTRHDAGVGANSSVLTSGSPLSTTSASMGAASGSAGAGLGSAGAGLGSAGAGLGSAGSGLGSAGAGFGLAGAGLGLAGAGLGSVGSGLGSAGAGLGSAGAGLVSAGAGLVSAGVGFIPIYSVMNYQPFCFIPVPSPYMVPNFSLMSFSPLMVFMPVFTPSYVHFPVLVPMYAGLSFNNFQPTQAAPKDEGQSQGATNNKTKLSFQSQTGKVITPAKASKNVQFDLRPSLPPVDYPEADNSNSSSLPRLAPPLAPPPPPSSSTPLIFTHPNRNHSLRLSPINNGNRPEEDSESEVVDRAFDFLNEDKSNN